MEDQDDAEIKQLRELVEKQVREINHLKIVIIDCLEFVNSCSVVIEKRPYMVMGDGHLYDKAKKGLLE